MKTGDLLSQNHPLRQLLGDTHFSATLAALQDNREAFDARLRLFQRKPGSLRQAVGLAQLTANCGWFGHPGRFCAPLMDQALGDLAGSLTLPARQLASPVPKGAVTHLLTRAFHVGGHTKFVYRWIREQGGVPHNVVLTAQQGNPVPPQLLELVGKSGGRLIDLQRESGAWTRQLVDLVGSIDAASQVVLHVHPYDAMAVVGLKAARSRPPTYFMNHADHVFWLGADVADRYIHFRSSAVGLSEQRRGIPHARCDVLPIPIDGVPDTTQRMLARERLGLPDDAVVALTMASGYKLAAVGRIDFAELQGRIAARHQKLVHFVIGQHPDARWRQAMDASGGRLCVLPPMAGVSDYLHAADLYVDSYPLASITSFLEAGIQAKPIISFDPWAGRGGLILAAEPVVQGLPCKFFEEEAYIAQFDRLVTDPVHRNELGVELAERIQNRHGSGSWRECLMAILNKDINDSAADKDPGSVVSHQSLDRIETMDMILCMAGKTSVAYGRERDLLVSRLPLSGKIEYRRLERFGPAGWLPEKVLVQLLQAKNRLR